MPRPGFVQSKVGAKAAGFIKPSLLKKGTEISGIYRGSFKDSYSEEGKEKYNHRIELEVAVTLPTQANEDAPIVLKDFNVGDLIILNSASKLDKQVLTYPEGTSLDIVYEGKGKASVGKDGRKMKPPHLFIVGSVGAIPTGAANTTAEEADEDNSDDDLDL